MKNLAVPVAAFAFFVQPACVAAADGRPALRDVSSIRVANYGAPSVLLEGRDKVAPIVRELNALRGKAWRVGDAKLACYSTVVLSSGKKTLGTFRITPEQMVEREGAKGLPIYSLDIEPGDIPQLSQLLAEIAPPKGCN
jgi:hypothetical protein